MGHYWSEMRGEETELEKKQARAWEIAKELRKRAAAEFTLDELALVLRIGWSSYQDNYYDSQCDEIFAIAERLRSRGA